MLSFALGLLHDCVREDVGFRLLEGREHVSLAHYAASRMHSVSSMPTVKLSPGQCGGAQIQQQEPWGRSSPLPESSVHFQGSAAQEKAGEGRFSQAFGSLWREK